jgi:hypothetical protein
VRLAPAQVPPQAPVVERRVPGLRAEGGEGRKRRPLPRWHDPDPAEPAHVAQLEHPAVVERPPRPHVGVLSIGAHPQLPRHPEVDDQLPVVVELEQQVLPPPADALDHRTCGVGRRSELG